MGWDETGAQIPPNLEEVQAEHEPLVVLPEFSFDEPVAVTTAKRPKRRLATTLVFAILVIAVNLLTDVIYTLLDPRVRL